MPTSQFSHALLSLLLEIRNKKYFRNRVSDGLAFPWGGTHCLEMVTIEKCGFAHVKASQIDMRTKE